MKQDRPLRPDRRVFSSALLAALVAPACVPRWAREADVSADPAGLLDLAEGLTYRVLDAAGSLMDDGYRVPGRPDGMGCFEIDGHWVLMRNHELLPGYMAAPTEDAIPEAFDPLDTGSVTRLVIDPSTLEVRSSNLVLTGTRKNCGGGVTSHGWLSCEENIDPGHGWVFLCDPHATSVQQPHLVESYGRFRHEAAVLDERTGIAYLTEDEFDSCLYRFVPDDPTDPFGAGRLEALAVDSGPSTATWATGTTAQVHWVPVDDPTAGSMVRMQAQAAGAATFVRGEGAWLAGDRLVFAATHGGPANAGQVFELDTANDVLRVLTASTEGDVLDSPDNLTIAPDGTVLVVEDTIRQCLLHALRPDGELVTLGRSVLRADELAGICFSPDGRMVFVNLMGSQVTLAIEGLDRLLSG